MHAERSEKSPYDPASGCDTAVMMVLLTGEHGLWTIDELDREVSGPRGDGGNIGDAVSHLYGRGLIHVVGEFVTPTRAARAMDELSGGA
jgi:hypothetical protein